MPEAFTTSKEPNQAGIIDSRCFPTQSWSAREAGKKTVRGEGGRHVTPQEGRCWFGGVEGGGVGPEGGRGDQRRGTAPHLQRGPLSSPGVFRLAKGSEAVVNEEGAGPEHGGSLGVEDHVGESHHSHKEVYLRGGKVDRLSASQPATSQQGARAGKRAGE